jgi:hypothetical protein
MVGRLLRRRPFFPAARSADQTPADKGISGAARPAFRMDCARIERSTISGGLDEKFEHLSKR